MHRLGIEPAGMVIHHDQDPLYTSDAWTGRLLLYDRLQLFHTLDGAKDNPEMEALTSCFKNENRSLILDAATIEMLTKIVKVRKDYYNDVRRHSVLDNHTPRKALERWLRDVDEDHE